MSMKRKREFSILTYEQWERLVSLLEACCEINTGIGGCLRCDKVEMCVKIWDEFVLFLSEEKVRGFDDDDDESTGEDGVTGTVGTKGTGDEQ